MKDLDTAILQILKEDSVDEVKMDVPLFIRILEYAREDAKTDMDLHNVATKAIEMTKRRGCLKMVDYEKLV